jgi:hypothetical protein
MLPDLQQPIFKVSLAKTRHTSLCALVLGFHRILKPAFAQTKVLVMVQEGCA